MHMFSNHKESISNKNLNPKELGSYLKTNFSHIFFFKPLIFKKVSETVMLIFKYLRGKKKEPAFSKFKKMVSTSYEEALLIIKLGKFQTITVKYIG